MKRQTGIDRSAIMYNDELESGVFSRRKAARPPAANLSSYPWILTSSASTVLGKRRLREP